MYVSWNCFQILLPPSDYDIYFFFLILVQHSEFRHLSLYHKDILPALCLASKVENSQRLLCVAVQHFMPWLWALKLNPFKMRWKCCSALPLLIKWPLPFRYSLLCCFSALAMPANAVHRADSHCAMWYMSSLAVCMAKDFSSSMTSGTASRSTYSACLETLTC